MKNYPCELCGADTELKGKTLYCQSCTAFYERDNREKLGWTLAGFSPEENKEIE